MLIRSGLTQPEEIIAVVGEVVEGIAMTFVAPAELTEDALDEEETELTSFEEEVLASAVAVLVEEALVEVDVVGEEAEDDVVTVGVDEEEELASLRLRVLISAKSMMYTYITNKTPTIRNHLKICCISTYDSICVEIDICI